MCHSHPFTPRVNEYINKYEKRTQSSIWHVVQDVRVQTDSTKISTKWSFPANTKWYIISVGSCICVETNNKFIWLYCHYNVRTDILAAQCCGNDISISQSLSNTKYILILQRYSQSWRRYFDLLLLERHLSFGSEFFAGCQLDFRLAFRPTSMDGVKRVGRLFCVRCALYTFEFFH